MKKATWILLVLLTALIWTGCRKEQEIPEEQKEQRVDPADSVWTLCIQAEKPVRDRNDQNTKGLVIGDGEPESNTTFLQSVWKAGEPVEVYLAGTHIGTLTATPNPLNAHKATLSGTVTTSSIIPGSTQLTLLTPRKEWDYTGQVGKLLLQDDPNNAGDKNRSIEKKYHYTMAKNVLVTGATVNNEGNGSLTTEDAAFTNQQSIYRLSFRFQLNGQGYKHPIEARRISIRAANGGLVKTRKPDGTETTGPIKVILETPTSNPVFVSLRNQNTTEDEALFFQVTDYEGITYYGSKTIPAAYKPNGTFVSIKNATLTSRLELSQNATPVDVVL